MRKNVKIVFWIMLLCTGCFLAAWNLCLIWSDDPDVPLAVAVGNIEFQKPFSQSSKFQAKLTDIRQKVKTRFVLKNNV